MSSEEWVRRRGSGSASGALWTSAVRSGDDGRRAYSGAGIWPVR